MKLTKEKQTKIESAIEVTLNIASGFLISFLVWIGLVPIFWPHLASSNSTAFLLTSLFTVTSFIRSYLWRRFFENDVHKFIHTYLSNRWRNHAIKNRKEI